MVSRWSQPTNGPCSSRIRVSTISKSQIGGGELSSVGLGLRKQMSSRVYVVVLLDCWAKEVVVDVGEDLFSEPPGNIKCGVVCSTEQEQHSEQRITRKYRSP